MLLHRTIIAAIAGASKSTPVYPTDVHLSYLPLAHIYERLVVAVGMASGSSLGFFQGVRFRLSIILFAMRYANYHLPK
jgi:long-chain acyl-CoA synthetase